MKHIKKFEKWTTDVTDDIVVNYGNKEPEISEFVKNVKNYIENNFDNISQITIDELTITFKNSDKIVSIKLHTNDRTRIYSIEFKYIGNYNTKRIDITKYEYDYISDYFYDINSKFRKKLQKISFDEISSDVDPAKISADKYNL